MLCSFRSLLSSMKKRRRDASRRVTHFIQKASHRVPTSSATPASSQPFNPYFITYSFMPFSQEHWKSYSHGTWCTVALHPLITSIDSVCSLLHPSPSDHAPHLRFSAQARSHPGLPPHNRTCFQMDVDVGRNIAHIIHTHRSVSSSQSLPRTSSHSSSNRKQQATQRPIRQNSPPWRTFHSCSACLAL